MTHTDTGGQSIVGATEAEYSRLRKALYEPFGVARLPGDMYTIYSPQSGESYTVARDLQACECHDFMYRGSINGTRCKHLLLVELLESRLVCDVCLFPTDDHRESCPNDSTHV